MSITADNLKSLTLSALVIKNDLAAAQRAFAKLPNSTNWQVCLRAMFTHQQIDHAIRSHAVDRNKLAFDLTVNPRGEWQNIICRATLGLGIRDCIQEFAVF
jgi:FPC/CPF motif-containing protein YcgG